jgi:hypothetical protein
MTQDMKELSDSQVADREREALAKGREVHPRIRAGKGTRADYEARAEAVETIRTARDEMKRRSESRSTRSLVDRLSGKRGAFYLVRQYDSEVLDGVSLSSDRVSDEEVAELRNLLKQRRLAGEAHEEWDDEERLRYEALMGKAAGDDDLFKRRRAEIAARQEREAEMRKLADAFLPRRREAKPGEVVLPRFLHAWLTDGTENAFDLHDLGLLAALCLAFANEDASLFPTGRFEIAEDGTRRIVITEAANEIRLVRGANDSDHTFRVSRCLATLKRNNWIETSRVRGTLTITPGRHMRKLFE